MDGGTHLDAVLQHLADVRAPGVDVKVARGAMRYAGSPLRDHRPLVLREVYAVREDRARGEEPEVVVNGRIAC